MPQHINQNSTELIQNDPDIRNPDDPSACATPDALHDSVLAESGTENLSIDPDHASFITAEFTHCDTEGKNWHIRIAFRDIRGAPQFIDVPRSLCKSNLRKVLGLLYDAGLSQQNDRIDVLDFIATLDSPDVRTRTTHFGWQDDLCTAFVTPAGRVWGSSAYIFGSKGAEAPPRSSLAEWQADLLPLIENNDMALFAVFLGLTPVLLQQCKYDGFFALFHGASSSGKSSLLTLAASVFSTAGIKSADFSDADLRGDMQKYPDILVALDEVKKLPKNRQMLSDAIYAAGNGKPASRSKGDGSLRGARASQTVLVASAEHALVDLLGPSREGGHIARSMSIRADDRAFGAFDDICGFPDGGAFAMALTQAAQRHAGVLGDAFCQKITDDPDSFRTRCDVALSAINDRLVQNLPHDNDKRILRLLKSFAMIHLAAKVACTFGLLPCSPGRVLNIILQVAEKVIAAIPTETRTEAHISQMILAHIDQCAPNLGVEQGKWRTHNDRDIFLSETEVIIMPDLLDQICAGIWTDARVRDQVLRRCDGGILTPSKSQLRYRFLASLDQDRPYGYRFDLRKMEVLSG